MKSVKFASPSIGTEELVAMQRVLERGVLSRGVEVAAFENEFALLTKTKHAVAVSSGTTGLHLAVRSLKWQTSDSIVTTPFSFIASGNCLLYEKIVPRFIDTEIEATYPSIENVLSAAPSGVLLVNLFGERVPDSLIKGILKENIKVLEDSCEATSTAPTSQHSEVSVYGFFENKQITTAGEGGMLVTNDDSIAEYARSARDQGKKDGAEWLEHVQLGFNYRMTEVQAAFGRAQLSKLPYFEIARRRIFELFKFFLGNVVGARIFRRETSNNDCFFTLPILFDTNQMRNDVALELKQNNVETRCYFTPMHLFPQFKQLGFRPGQFPNSEDLYSRLLNLPLHSNLTEQDIAAISRIVKSACQRRAAA